MRAGEAATRGEEMVERHILGAFVFFLLLLAGLLLANHFEPCEHGRDSLLAPCHDPSGHSPSC